jgi:hypothetical protein
MILLVVDSVRELIIGDRQTGGASQPLPFDITTANARSDGNQFTVLRRSYRAESVQAMVL